jgi:hypothetical protein
MDVFVIWSFDHQAWVASPNVFVTDLDRACRYSPKDAKQIEHERQVDGHNDLALPLDEVAEWYQTTVR